MNQFSPRGVRTLFAGIVAHGDHKIEEQVSVLVGMVRRMVRRIDTIFGHHLYRQRIYAMRGHARVVDRYLLIVAGYIGKVLEVAVGAAPAFGQEYIAPLPVALSYSFPVVDFAKTALFMKSHTGFIFGKDPCLRGPAFP